MKVKAPQAESTTAADASSQSFNSPDSRSAQPSPDPAARDTVAPWRRLPLAPKVKGSRPRSDPSLLPPAATVFPPGLGDLKAPAPLALPVKPAQVRIREYRPLGLDEVETLAELNNPELKALASQVEQAQSALRAQISLWYPQINLNARQFPTYSGGELYRQGQPYPINPRTGKPININTNTGQPFARNTNSLTSIWNMQAVLEASWSLIDPTRTPKIAAARDNFEKAKNQYLIGLRDLRLQASQAYFDLQQADEQVRIGQESVRASLVSLRDARARFQAGVATKLEVLEAETQLARDQQLLSTALAQQAIARRTLASILDLPQDVTPTAKDPSQVLGTWLPSLQESIIAAYGFREELDQIILDISIANSNANVELGSVQPFLRIVNNFTVGRSYGYETIPRINTSQIVGLDGTSVVPTNETGWSVDNTVGLNFSWNIFDGGRARALYRQQKQVANENRYQFANRRDIIREEVETSFYNLEKNNRNITTTSREVISTRESLRLARLRFQAGVTTQREVVDTQRDLTQAEVRYSSSIADYNKALAELRRRTGLDQIAICQRQALPPAKPVVEGASDVPVEPQPLAPPCNAGARPIGVTDLHVP